MTFNDIKEIKKIVSALVEARIDGGNILTMEWAVTEVLNDFPDIHGDDADFYIITARHYVNEQVKSAVKKFEPSEDSVSGQLVMEGFEYLQKAYPVVRGKTRQLVPVTLLTDDELEMRALEYERMADGCKAHAREIRGYIDARKQTA